MTTTDPETGPTPATLRPRLRALRKTGDFAAALALLDPPHPDLDAGFVRLERARTLHQAGRDTEALAELDHDDTPGTGPALLRTRILIALDRPEDAQAVFDTAQGDPELIMPLSRTLALALLDRGSFGKAARVAARARELHPDSPPASGVELQCLMLDGDPDGLNRALETRRKKAMAKLAQAVRRSLARLDGLAGTADRAACTKNVVDCTTQALDRVSDPLDARALRFALGDACPPATAAKIEHRRAELVRAQIPDSPWDITGQPRQMPRKMKRTLTRAARWLGLQNPDIADWVDRAWTGLDYKKRLAGAVTLSDPHRDQMSADLAPLDWSEVRACQNSGQPVLLVGLHSHFHPAQLIEFNRLGPGVKLATRNWPHLLNPAFGHMFFDPPARALPDSPANTFSTIEMARAILRHLTSGGVVALAVDGQQGASPVHLENGLHVSLPGSQWALARRTGAAVFYIEAIWKDDRLITRLTRWPVPDGTDPQADEALWQDRLISAWAASCREDPRNALPMPWLLEVESIPDPAPATAAG